MSERGRVHPDCKNSSNPYHQCVEECYQKVGKGKPHKSKNQSGRHSRLLALFGAYFCLESTADHRGEPMCCSSACCSCLLRRLCLSLRQQDNVA